MARKKEMNESKREKRDLKTMQMAFNEIWLEKQKSHAHCGRYNHHAITLGDFHGTDADLVWNRAIPDRLNH